MPSHRHTPSPQTGSFSKNFIWSFASPAVTLFSAEDKLVRNSSNMACGEGRRVGGWHMRSQQDPTTSAPTPPIQGALILVCSTGVAFERSLTVVAKAFRFAE